MSTRWAHFDRKLLQLFSRQHDRCVTLFTDTSHWYSSLIMYPVQLRNRHIFLCCHIFYHFRICTGITGTKVWTCWGSNSCNPFWSIPETNLWCVRERHCAFRSGLHNGTLCKSKYCTVALILYKCYTNILYLPEYMTIIFF